VSGLMLLKLETRVGGVKIIFRLPTTLFNGSAAPPAWSKHPRLAHVEWFSAFKPSHEQHHLTYSVVEPWPRADGRMQGSIIPLTDIRQTCQLFNFQTLGRATTSDVLDLYQSFFVNNWGGRYAYQSIW
ncbi:hypothetical protein B0H16DRAFT_1315343, partial [Mycena metata]